MITNRLSRLAVAALAGIGVAAAFLPTAQAQPAAPAGRMAPSGGVDAAQRAKMQQAQQKVIADLHITPDQQAKLKKVQADVQPKMMAIYTSKTLTQDQKKTQMMALGAKSRAQMNAIFTPEQRTKLKALQDQMMQQRMKQMQAGAAAKPAH